MRKKIYLGDAVYAEHDGYGVELTTSDGIRNTNTIYLEPEVFDALVVFRYRVRMEGRVDSVRPGGASLSVWVRLNGSRQLIDVSEHQVLGVVTL